MFLLLYDLNSGVSSGSCLYLLCIYLLCISQSECKFISMDLKLHRIAHRSKLHKGELRTGYNTHVKKMLS